MTWWHGGSRIVGDMVQPQTGAASRSGEVDRVFVTTDRSLAVTYASTTDGATAWVYEVEPLTEPEPVQSLIQPDAEPISFWTTEARIVKRFTVSNADREKVRQAMVKAEGLLTRRYPDTEAVA